MAPPECNLDTVQYIKLPKQVIPTHYNLYLKPNLETCQFEGNVTVNLKVVETVHELIFHSVALDLSNVDLQADNGTSITTQFKCLEEQESVCVPVPSGLQPGSYKLHVKFNGSLNDNLRGFYKAAYTSPDGDKRFCAITQFQASKAHRCFPCWDEPAFKATFDVTVCCAEDRVALSNMPVLSEKKGSDGHKVVQFCTSPIMSTYLLAIVVGEFDYIEQTTANGVKVRVYTPLNKQEQGQFSLDAAVKMLPYFENYFKIPYPLPKLDLIAVPSLSFGAMENWGLITYRETCLLVDPKISSTEATEDVAVTVAHEIAHQWFGNLVTMEWWDHLWLNEGFATYMSFLCVDKIFPEFQIWNQFITYVYSPAMKLDSLQTSHAVEMTVKHPLHVDEVFDNISYNKGASLIRMVHAYIGSDNFEKGMHLYLKKFQSRNASTEDLWQVLEEVSQKPVISMMLNWTQKAGYPVISVERVQEGDLCKLSLKQSQFCATGSHGGTNCTTWIMPVEYCTSKSQVEPVGKFEFGSSKYTLAVEGLNKSDWVKLNPSNLGFYRVHYSSEMLESIMPAIADLSLQPIDRLGLLDDLFALVQAGYSRSDKILELLLTMSNEDSCMVWSMMSRVLKKLKNLLEYTDASIQKNFKSFGQFLLRHIKENVAWDPKADETHEDKLLRTLILDLLGEFGDKATVTEAEKRLKAHLNGSAPLAADLRAVVYAIGMENADSKLYNELLEVYHNETLQEEKERILFGLTYMKDENLIHEAMMFTLSDSVRKESTLRVLAAIAQVRSGREQVWDYLKCNWDSVVENHAGAFALPGFITRVFSCAASRAMASDLETICKHHSIMGMERSIAQAIENISVNARWLEQDTPLIASFLKSYD